MKKRKLVDNPKYCVQYSSFILGIISYYKADKIKKEKGGSF